MTRTCSTLKLARLSFSALCRESLPTLAPALDRDARHKGEHDVVWVVASRESGHEERQQVASGYRRFSLSGPIRAVSPRDYLKTYEDRGEHTNERHGLPFGVSRCSRQEHQKPNREQPSNYRYGLDEPALPVTGPVITKDRPKPDFAPMPIGCHELSPEEASGQGRSSQYSKHLQWVVSRSSPT